MDLFGRKAKNERLQRIAREEKEEDEHTKRIESLVKLKPIEILKHLIIDNGIFYEEVYDDKIYRNYLNDASVKFFEICQSVIDIEDKLNFKPEHWKLWYSINQFIKHNLEFNSLSIIFLDKAIEADHEHWELWLKKAEYLSSPSKRCVKKIESMDTGKSKYQVVSTENPTYSYDSTPPLCNNDEIFACLDRAVEMNKEIFEAGEFKAKKLYSMGNQIKTNEESLERISKCHECCDEMIVNILKSWVPLEQKGKEISYANKENWQFDCMTYFNKANERMYELKKFVEIKASCHEIVKNDEDFFRGFIELLKKNEFIFNSLHFYLWESLVGILEQIKEEERQGIMKMYGDPRELKAMEYRLENTDLLYDDLIKKCHVRIIHP
jgi:tetratricopeptide (TPR) repeat protein